MVLKHQEQNNAPLKMFNGKSTLVVLFNGIMVNKGGLKNRVTN